MKIVKYLCHIFFISASLLSCLFFFIQCTFTEENGNHWEDLGYASIGSAGEPWEGYYGISMTIDPMDHKPVVAANDAGWVRVQKWSTGTTWIDLGHPVNGSARLPSVVIDPSDCRPVVVLCDGTAGGRARVLKWSSGTTWIDLGYVSQNQAHDPSIAIDPADGKPIVVFAEFVGGSFNFIQVLKWSSGTTWTDLGYPCPGEGMDPSLVIDPSDKKPIVAFTAENYEYVQVVKWSNGTTWIDLGAPEPGEGEGTSLVIDPSDNKPIIVFGRGGAYVKKWSVGTTWVDMGWANFSESLSADIAIGSDYKPVVAIADQYNGGKTHVKKWSGGTSWFSLGFPSTGEAGHISIAVDPSDNCPVVVFSDGSNGWRAHVMKYIPWK